MEPHARLGKRQARPAPLNALPSWDQNNTCILDRIVSDGITLELTSPIELKIRQTEEGYWELDFPEASIYILENAKEDVLREFMEDFVFVWEDYAFDDDESLTRDAIELKRWLLNKVKH